jgi:hypothetical protein
VMTAIATSIKVCTSCKGFGKITYYGYAGEGDMRCPLCDGSGLRRFPYGAMRYAYCALRGLCHPSLICHAGLRQTGKAK